ncbi:MAG: sulfotransferase [Dongiaceae bacterium]
MSADATAPNAAANPMQGRLAAAIAQHRAGKLADAERAYRDILAEDSGNADALHLLGALKQQSGKLDESIALVRQAIALKPNSALYHNTLGIAYGMTRAIDWAVEAFAKAAALSPRYPDPHVHLGNLLRMQGRKEEAVTHLERAVAIKPDFAEAHNNLGTLLIDMEQWRKAESHLMTAARLRPKNPEIAINLAVARRPIDSKAAIAGLQDVLAANPGHPAALTNLGAIYSDLGERDLALDCLRRALAAAPGNPQIKLDLANALSQFGDSREAKALYTEIARESAPPKRVSALIALAAIAERDGDFEDAAAYLEQANEIRPDTPAAMAGMLKRQGKSAAEELVQKAEQVLAEGTEVNDNRAALQMALGGVYAQRKEFRRAFSAYKTGNLWRRQSYGKRGIIYDRQAREKRVNAIIRAYDADFFRAHREGASSSNLPVFVVGMPRSGTTLCEQILASHSDVHGADELMDISIAASRLDPANYRGGGSETKGPLRIDHQALHNEAARYLGVLKSMAPDAKRVIDKMPANFENLGLIAAMFPHAKIIHCRRDPRDIALSCFTTKFLYPLVWSLDLDDFSHYYAQYRRMMEHWRRVLPMPMLERQYETAVADFEASSRQLVDFCGLDWQDVCLEFHKTERTVRTASIRQVRQPVYTSSIGRWRDYEAEAPEAFRRIGALESLT